MDDGRPAPVWTPAKCGLLCAGKDMYRYRYFTGISFYDRGLALWRAAAAFS